MQWEEIQRIERELVIPELEDWAAGVAQHAQPRGRQLKRNELPPWMLRTLIMSSGQRRPLGPIGNIIGVEGQQIAYDAMSIVLCAKYGITSIDKERNDFLVSLESLLWPLGPRDDLCGQGPGKPVAVFRDELGRLHKSDGPALVFSDRRMHVLRGVFIPAREWELRDDAKRLLDVQNVEVRRALIERMGVREFIGRAGLQPTHEDRFGSFYRLTHVFDSYGYVHVTCPSTRQDYFLAVPGNCRSAHEAVAWTFSMVPEDYAPEKEA